MAIMHIDLKVGETLSIDDGRVLITLEEKSGQRARLKVDANKDVPVRKAGATASSIARKGIGNIKEFAA